VDVSDMRALRRVRGETIEFSGPITTRPPLERFGMIRSFLLATEGHQALLLGLRGRSEPRSTSHAVPLEQSDEPGYRYDSAPAARGNPQFESLS
jgi:hypothetical protein